MNLLSKSSLPEDGMADGLRLSLDEYLQTSFHPDCDFVDGEAQERLWGEYRHSKVQGKLLSLLQPSFPLTPIIVLPSLRIKVANQRVRVADIAVLRQDHPREQIITVPPILCIEILSPEDRFGRMEQKIADYLQMGVRAVWVIDPPAKAGYDCRGGHLSEWMLTSRLSIPGASLEIDVPALFAALD